MGETTSPTQETTRPRLRRLRAIHRPWAGLIFVILMCLHRCHFGGHRAY